MIVEEVLGLPLVDVALLYDCGQILPARSATLRMEGPKLFCTRGMSDMVAMAIWLEAGIASQVDTLPPAM